MSSTLTNLTAATTWSGTDLFYALVGGNSRKIAASKFLVAETSSSLAMQDSTTAQTFRLYRTFTDSSNYERLALTSSAGQFEITAQTAGTGTDDLSLQLSPSGRGDVSLILGFSGSSVGLFKTTTTTSWTDIEIAIQETYVRSSGTAAAGFGASWTFFLENSAGSDVSAGRFAFVWTNATASSEKSDIRIYTNVGERLRVSSTTTATETSLSIYDVDNAGLEVVRVGAADSAGAGFKLLRIAN